MLHVHVFQTTINRWQQLATTLTVTLACPLCLNCHSAYSRSISDCLLLCQCPIIQTEPGCSGFIFWFNDEENNNMMCNGDTYYIPKKKKSRLHTRWLTITVSFTNTRPKNLHGISLLIKQNMHAVHLMISCSKTKNWYNDLYKLTSSTADTSAREIQAAHPYLIDGRLFWGIVSPKQPSCQISWDAVWRPNQMFYNRL